MSKEAFKTTVAGGIALGGAVLFASAVNDVHNMEPAINRQVEHEVSGYNFQEYTQAQNEIDDFLTREKETLKIVVAKGEREANILVPENVAQAIILEDSKKEIIIKGNELYKDKIAKSTVFTIGKGFLGAGVFLLGTIPFINMTAKKLKLIGKEKTQISSQI